MGGGVVHQTASSRATGFVWFPCANYTATPLLISSKRRNDRASYTSIGQLAVFVLALL